MNCACPRQRSLRPGHHRPDVPILEHRAFPLGRDGNIDHGSGQVVGPNHLVRKQRPERRVDRAQEAVADIRFLPRIDGIDVRRTEDVQAREPCGVKGVFGLALVTCERQPTASRRIRAAAAQE